MIKTAEETGVTFAVMFQQRSLPVHQAAKKLVDEGRLGPLYRTLLTDCHFRSQAYYNSAGWRATWKGEGGGVLLNQAPHGMDIFTWLAGMPSKVMAQVNTRQHVIEVEDEAAAILEYENGAIGYMLETVNEYPTGMRIELCGEKGKLVLDGRSLRFWEVKPGVRAASDGVEAMWGRPDAEEVAVELEDRATGPRRHRLQRRAGHPARGKAALAGAGGHPQPRTGERHPALRAHRPTRLAARGPRRLRRLHRGETGYVERQRRGGSAHHRSEPRRVKQVGECGRRE